MRRPSRILLCFLPAFLGCKAVDPAPEDLEGLLHWFWLNGDIATDAELADGRDKLHEALGDAPLDDPLDGMVGSLTDEEVAVAELDREVDPTEAAGMWIASGFDCSLGLVEDLVTAPEQDAYYDIFDSYERRYTSDAAAFDAGETATLDWEVTYGATIPFAGPYVADLVGGARRVATSDRDLLILRSTLVEPAAFENDGNVFDQDYRVELYYAPSPGRVRHVEAMWRHMDAGPVNTANETIQRVILNGLADWDEQTAAWCESGLP